jgi:prophage tail gpP-like protein/phage tail protein X
MSGVYVVQSGDTFSTVARKVYGTEQLAEQVRKANPGVLDALTSGTTLIIPDIPGAPVDAGTVSSASNENEVALLIGGTRVQFWGLMSIRRSMDSIDSIGLTAPFEPDDPVFREIFKPMSFKDMVVTVGGESLFKGTMVGVEPQTSQAGKEVSVNGYSTPGVLNDCTPSANDYPIEYDSADLRGIATGLSQPFGVTTKFIDQPGEVFERVSVKPSDRVLGFLINLAQQRTLLISSSERGELLFQKESTGVPVAILTEGESPLLNVEALFNPQAYYSHITGVEPAIVGLPGGQYTVRNPLLNNITRPSTFVVTDTQGGDVQSVVEAKAGRMIGSAVVYTVRVATWRDVTGSLWQPNTTIKLKAPGAMVYDHYTFLIKSVNFTANANEKTAVLDLVLPGSYAGKMPETLPWD